MLNEPPTPARPDELDALTALLAAQLEEHAIALDRALLSDAVRGALEDDGRALILVARQAHRAVGLAFLSFHPTLERGGRVMWLEELYVVPELRQRGIGGQLLGAALEVARARGCRAAELEVESSHSRAAHLYARAGFQPLQRVHWTLPLR